jgi:hypothetical protein
MTFQRIKLKRREKNFIDKGKLLKALEGTSRETPIKAPDLEIMVNALENRSGNNRNIRTAITELLRDEAYLIGSGAKGFFMINNLVELTAYIHRLENYAQGTINRIGWLKRAWRHRHPTKLLLKLKQEVQDE